VTLGKGIGKGIGKGKGDEGTALGAAGSWVSEGDLAGACTARPHSQAAKTISTKVRDHQCSCTGFSNAGIKRRSSATAVMMRALSIKRTSRNDSQAKASDSQAWGH
jgi:hypothetical protein